MTPPDPLCFLNATEAARRIAAGELTSVDLVEAVLAQAARFDPILTLFAHPMAEEARTAAHQADNACRAGVPLGPLHGVPITIKDNVALAGVPMRHGSVAAPPVVPARDGIASRRVKQAGAIVIGKTTLPEFAHKVLTDNPDDGVTRNPWSLDHTPGGSSGGASAALAAGVAPLAIGTDGGGSIRCPASCTSTVGLKATLGRIPNETAPDAFGNFFFIGPMARNVADVRLLLSVMQGPSGADPYALVSTSALRSKPLHDLRIGWIDHIGSYRTDDEVVQVTAHAVERLASLGAQLRPLRPACFDNLFPTYQILATSAHATRFGHLADREPLLLTESMQASIAIGRSWSAVDLLGAQDRRTALFRAVQAWFDEVDVIATPTMTAPPPGLDAGGSIATQAFGEWAAALYPFNMTGHPALSVPAGFTRTGLPIGLQLVGPWNGDDGLLDLAAALEADLVLDNRPPLTVPTP